MPHELAGWLGTKQASLLAKEARESASNINEDTYTRVENEIKINNDNARYRVRKP